MQALGRERMLPIHVYVLVFAVVEVVPLGFAIAATAVAAASLRLGVEQVGTRGAYERAVHHRRPLAGVLLRVAGIPLLLAATIGGLPVAVWYFGRTAVAGPACVLEDLDTRAAIRIAVALLVGPIVGAVVLLRTDLPVLLANLIGVAFSAAVLPLVGITITLLFPRPPCPRGRGSARRRRRARPGGPTSCRLHHGQCVGVLRGQGRETGHGGDRDRGRPGEHPAEVAAADEDQAERHRRNRSRPRVPSGRPGTAPGSRAPG